MAKKLKEWTPNRYLVAAARRIWRWDKNRKAVNDEAERQAGKKGWRLCAHCKKRYKRQVVHVDHISSVGAAPKGLEGWDAYYIKLFTTRDNLQCLCITCHKKKTAEQRKQSK